MVLLRHASPRRNMLPIHWEGLRADKARGKLKAVWLHAATRSRWAKRHVARRHGCAESAVVFYVVDVPRRLLQARAGSSGLFFVRADVPPERFRGFFMADRV